MAATATNQTGATLAQHQAAYKPVAAAAIAELLATIQRDQQQRHQDAA
jgi:hypothetical protein